MAESQWYLEVNGKKVGPFNLEHIQGLYDDGEIKGYHQVTSDQLDGQWISVQELVDSLTVSAPPSPPTEDLSSERSAESDVTSQIEMTALPILSESPESEDADSPPSFPSSVQSERTSENSYVSAPVAPALPRDFNAGFHPPPRPGTEKTNTGFRMVNARPPTEAVIETESALPVLENAPSSDTGLSPLEAHPVEIEESSYTSPDQPPVLPPIVATLAQTSPNNDPALSMLSSLQLFKERQGNHREQAYDPSLVIHSDTLGSGNSASFRMWMTAVFAGLVLGCLSWGVIRVLRSKTNAPAGTMVQHETLTTAPPPHAAHTAQSAPTTPPPTTSAGSLFKAAEAPKESSRRAPPRPLTPPPVAPAPVRVQSEEQRRDEQLQQEQPPQPQYAPQYQQYPQTGDQLQNVQPQGAPVPPPAQNVNGQNIYPSEQMPPAYPANGGAPGADSMAPPPQVQQQPPPGTMGGYPNGDPNFNNGQNNGVNTGVDPNQPQPNTYNNGGQEQQPPPQPASQ